MTRIAAIAFALGTAISASVSAQAPARPGAPGSDSFSIQDFGTIPRPVMKMGLLRMEPIQVELKMTDAQKEVSTSPKLFEPFQEKIQAARGVEDPEKRMAAMQVIQQEIQAAVMEVLEPGQRERLDQIQLQLQGPEAFLLPDFQKRLGLTGDQVEKIRPIVEEGRAEMIKTSAVPSRPG